MRWIYRSAAAVFFFTALTLTAAPKVNIPAPDFVGVTAEGETIHLASLRGHIVVLEWSNHECPYVRKHYESGNMQSLQKKWTDRGVVWLTVLSSAPGKQGYVDPSRAQELTVERDAHPTAVILDARGKIGKLYDARTTPQMYIIDEKGTLVYMGSIDDERSLRKSSLEGARNHVDEALSELMSGKPVTIQVSAPYGCSIKY
jgi:peroxiredoxin